MHKVKLSIRGVWIRRIQAGIVGLVIGSIISVLLKTWGQVKEIPWVFNPGFLVSSFILVSGLVIFWAFIWSWLLQQIAGKRLSLNQVASIYIYGNTTKYIPGSAWNFFAKAYLGSRVGINQDHIWLANITEFLGGATTGFFLYEISLLWSQVQKPITSPYLLVALLLFLFIINSPGVLGKIYARVQFWRKNNISVFNPTYNFFYYCIYMIITGLVWTIIGISFFLFIRSFYFIDPSLIPATVGAWSLATSIGMLAIGFPQGVGVKDGVLVFLLTAVVPLPTAFYIAVLARVWTILCDLLALFFWWLVDRVWLKHPIFQVKVNSE